jgi:hypothetical protein
VPSFADESIVKELVSAEGGFKRTRRKNLEGGSKINREEEIMLIQLTIGRPKNELCYKFGASVIMHLLIPPSSLASWLTRPNMAAHVHLTRSPALTSSRALVRMR